MVIRYNRIPVHNFKPIPIVKQMSYKKKKYNNNSSSKKNISQLTQENRQFLQSLGLRILT